MVKIIKPPKNQLDCRKSLVEIKLEAKAKLPTQFGEFEILSFSNNYDNKIHLALTRGEFSVHEITLVRVHSECMTGDIFASKRCDCGEQLTKSLQLIAQNNCGVLIYLRQEGRGIGIVNKLHAYNLQDQNFDTIEANLKLGLAHDYREYFLAAKILTNLNITKINLISNNPEKKIQLIDWGIEVNEMIAISSTVYPENEKYLLTKINKLAHNINLNKDNSGL